MKVCFTCICVHFCYNFNGVFFLWHLNPTPGHGLPFWGYAITLIGHITLGRTSLDEWSARHRDLYLTTHNTQKRQTSMPLAGFEPTVSASKWLHTQALVCVATGISSSTNSTTKKLQKSMIIHKPIINTSNCT